MDELGITWITKNGYRIPIFTGIKLEPKEYGHVCHEIESNGSYEQKREGMGCTKVVGNYFYIYEYHQLENIKFYGRILIEGNEETIQFIDEYIRSGNKYGFY